MVRRRLAAWLGMLLLLVTLIGDLWRVNRQFLVLTDPPNRTEAVTSPALQWIKGQQPAGSAGATVPLERTLLLGSADPMRYAAAKIPVLFTANAVQKRRWQEYLDAFALQSPLPQLMNVRWVVYDQQLYDRDQAHFGEQYRLAFSGGSEVVLENRQLLPKAWLVSNVELIADPALRLKRIQQPSFVPTETAVVESVPALALGGASGAAGPVQITRFEAEQLQFTAEPTVNSLLVVGEKFQQGWRATVDGQPAAIVPVNHILRGVYLPPGKHAVEFRFDPLPFKIGTWLTLGSFGLFLLIFLREWRRRSRHHAGSY